MKSIINNVEKEYIVNKSKFISKIYKVNNEKECIILINEIKEKYKDATHVCYAYIIDNIYRFNDDGEPGGTAGLPILNVLKNNELNYVLAIVIRYFGGIKLGAGGLTRAYSNSVSNAIDTNNIKNLEKCINIEIEFDYNKTKQIDYLLKEYNIEKEFDNNIKYKLYIPIDKYNLIKKELSTLCINIQEKEQLWN